MHQFTVKGHAGYAEKGKDVICAAVSAVAQTAILGLEAVTGLTISYSIEDDSGSLHCKVIEAKNQEARIRADAIVEAMILGLKSIEEGHKEFLRVKLRDIEEVSTCS